MPQGDQNVIFMTLLLKEMAGDGKDYNAQDIEFVRGMIPHHAMAVEMAGKEMEKGKNEVIVAVAAAIKKAQTAEISKLKKWLSDRDIDLGPSGVM